MQGDTPLLRQWSLLTALGVRRRGMTVREMADETGANIRSIRRDLATLQRVGFPLTETVSDHGRKHWCLAANGSAPPMSFTWAEAISLYLGRRFLEPLAGTYLWDGAQSAFAKIRAVLGDEALRYLEKMAGALHQTSVGASDYSKQAEVIDRLMIGIEDRLIAFLTYQSLQATEPVTYDVYPYALIWHRCSLYLVAHAVAHGEVRHYKIDRIHDVELDELKFVRPAGFDVREHLAGTFGVYHRPGRLLSVRVKFSPEVRRHVEESRFHASQRLTPDGDGGVIAEFTLSSFEELRAWVLSFGAHAEVLEPEGLRREVAHELERALEAYCGTERDERGGLKVERMRDQRFAG